ncbi:excalibur calcium-binding domain-containing protein [Cohnella sp. CIP 111063]|uniref:excalibur calcium-binding domain-containing protein n=1 Tax=unclassified Cohnella TaxID=2636738 RepID=UPI0035141C8C
MLFIVEKPKVLFPNQPATAAPAGNNEVRYPNCAAVREAGKAPLRKGDPGYSAKLDRDGDGVACE